MTPHERQLLLSSEHHPAGAPLADLTELLKYASFFERPSQLRFTVMFLTVA
jgi:hypothetical protein